MEARLPHPGLRLQRRDPDFKQPPPPPPPPPFTRITLTALNGAPDIRTLDLFLNDPLLVGRASRNKQKELQPTSNNTLFDCPVISRHHAELELVRGPRASEVVIRDIGARHGTKINGNPLKKYGECVLHRGDIIKLGEQIVLQQDKHDGVMLSFAYSTEPSPNSRAPQRPQPSRTFTVPLDDEEQHPQPSRTFTVPSDDDDAASSASDVAEVSSAKTTPEQLKAKPGSSNHPIDIDDTRPRHAEVVVLDYESEDDLGIPRKPRTDRASGALVNDIQVEDSLKIIPETYHDEYRPHQLSSFFHDSELAGPEYDDPEFEYESLSPRDDEKQDDVMDYEARNTPLDYGDEDSIDYEDDEEEEAGEMPAVEDEDDEEHEEDDQEEAPEVYPSKKQPSPELGTPLAIQNRRPTSGILRVEPLTNPESYDDETTRSRSNLKHTALPPFSSIFSANVGEPSRSMYETARSQLQPLATIKPRAYHSPTYVPYAQPTTNVWGRTRWDVLPEPTRVSYIPTSYDYYSGARNHYDMPQPARLSAPRAEKAFDEYLYSSSIDPWSETGYPNQTLGRYIWERPEQGPVDTDMNRDPIHKLYVSEDEVGEFDENQPSVTHQQHKENDDEAARPSKIVKLPIAVDEGTTGGKKRKADEMLETDEVEAKITAKPADLMERSKVTKDDTHDQPPPTQRRRTGNAATVLGAAAGGIGVGVGVGIGGVLAYAFGWPAVAQMAADML